MGYAIDLSRDPWAPLLLVAIVAGIVAFPFIMGGIAHCAISGAAMLLKKPKLEKYDFVVEVIVIAAIVELFALVVFLMPTYG